jgi:hypothetical protein
MKTGTGQWRAGSLGDLRFRVGADFVSQVLDKIESQNDLAEKLKITKGAVSQTLKSPGNLKLDTMVKYARALKMNISVILYEDHEKNMGPIHPDIFRRCWENANKPSDFFDLREHERTAITNDAQLVERNGTYICTYTDPTSGSENGHITVQGTGNLVRTLNLSAIPEINLKSLKGINNG